MNEIIFLVVSATKKIKHNKWSIKVSIFGFSSQRKKVAFDLTIEWPSARLWNSLWKWVFFQREQLEDSNGLE